MRIRGGGSQINVPMILFSLYNRCPPKYLHNESIHAQLRAEHVCLTLAMLFISFQHFVQLCCMELQRDITHTGVQICSAECPGFCLCNLCQLHCNNNYDYAPCPKAQDKEHNHNDHRWSHNGHISDQGATFSPKLFALYLDDLYYYILYVCIHIMLIVLTRLNTLQRGKWGLANGFISNLGLTDTARS